MAKGMSPLRLFMRNAPRKTISENVGESTSGPDDPIGVPQARQPLCPIAESGRNPLTTAAEQPIADSSTPRAKTEQTNSKANGKNSIHSHEKFPHLENSDGNVNSVNSSPDKYATTGPASAAAPSISKSKFTWQHRQNSMAQNCPKEGSSDVNTPPRLSKQSSVADVGQAANTSGTQLSTCNLRVASTGGGSVQSTPRTLKGVGASRPTNEPEICNSQSQNVTPSKSVSRSLKYGQPSSSSGTSGVANVRATGSQHVMPRPTGILQALKGATVQMVNQSSVEQHFELEEDPSFWRDHNVQVLIRTRPISCSELAAQGLNKCLKQESPHTLSWLGQPESRFTFDHVAGETVTQEKLFDVAGLPMVENCMSGYNSCMFAYGQTGSGKTHTMLGDIEDLDRRPRENRGMTPRVFEYLFARIQMEQEGRRQEHLKFFCKCSFLEIYNEQITDLLEPSSTNLQMREDAKKGVYVENLSEVEVTGVQDVIQLLLQGAANRKVAATNMNRESSRSHSVFTCVVESKWETNSNSMTNSRYGRLHLVDLAGSERQKSSGAEGGRLKEAANINKSLSTLGMVIMILVDVANGKQRHVPYRDSKLTFLLQDSLGGNSKTIMIANVSPSSCCAMETLSTLKFAQRAKFIRNNAVINEDASGDVIALRQQIEDLKVEVDRLRHESISKTPSMRFSAPNNGAVAVEESRQKVDTSVVDSTEIGQSSAESVDDCNFKTYSTENLEKKIRSIEVVLAAALRREQTAEDIKKKLAAEIEQLNRLVRQREEDSQCSKMMLRFREEKIRRLEGIADNLLSADVFYEQERTSLLHELQLIRARLDRNPELTRFAMENIRLMEQVRRYEEFYDSGERDVMIDEISCLRNQLLDALDKKLGDEHALGNLSTPQKRALVPECAALARENELLLIEVDNYQKELKECRNNLNSCLVSNAELARQVDQLEATMKQFNEARSLEVEFKREGQSPVDDAEIRAQLQEHLKNAIHESEHLQGKVQETALSTLGAPKRIRLETEGLASEEKQSLSQIEEAAVAWSKQESELRKQLMDAEDRITKLLEGAEMGKKSVALDSPRRLEETTGRKGVQDRLEKLHEIEMRHSEEIMQLQLEVESMELVLKEEKQQRSAAELKSEDLLRQLSAAVSSFEQEQAVVEALEGQQLFSINELQNLQAEHNRVLSSLKRQEEEKIAVPNEVLDMEMHSSFRSEDVTVDDVTDDLAVCILEQKLERAKKEKEEVRNLNRKFHEEKISRMALEKEMEVTMSEVETQAALAITTLQSEILDLKGEFSAAAEGEATAKLEALHLRKEVQNLQGIAENLEEHIKSLSNNYARLMSEKNAEIQGLEDKWETATAKLIDYLGDGDQALTEAAVAMEEIIDGSSPSKHGESWREQDVLQMKSKKAEGHDVERQNAVKSVYYRVQDAHLLARETEGKVRALSGATLARNAQAEPESLSETRHFEPENGEDLIRESEKKSMAAFLMVEQLLDRINDLSAASAANEAASVALHQEVAVLRRRRGELADDHQCLIGEHEELRQEYEESVKEVELRNEIAEATIRLSERKAMAAFVMLEQLLYSNKELEEANVTLAKEIQEAHLALGEKDMIVEALQQQLDADRCQYLQMSDRHQLLMQGHEKLQKEHECLQTEHEQFLGDHALSVDNGEHMTRLSERKAMAAFVVTGQLLDSIELLKAVNGTLGKEAEDARLIVREKDIALAVLAEQLDHDRCQNAEIAHRHQVQTEALKNLEQEHKRLVGDKTDYWERMIRLSEKKAIAAFVIIDQVQHSKKQLKAILERDIEETHMTLGERETALADMQLQQDQERGRYLELVDRHQLLMEEHEHVREEHGRLLGDRASSAEDGDHLIKLAERKAMGAFVMVDGLLDSNTALKSANAMLAKESQEAKMFLREKDIALADVQLQQDQDRCRNVEIAHRHQLLMKEHENLQKEQERLLGDRASSAEDGERLIKLAERKAVGAFVMVDRLLDSSSSLKSANDFLGKECQEAKMAVRTRDTALADVQLQQDQDRCRYLEIAHRQQLLMEKYETLQQEHETLLGSMASSAENGERLIKLAERKAMGAFVMADGLLDRNNELKSANAILVRESEDVKMVLAERNTTLLALRQQLDQEHKQWTEMASRHELRIDENERLVDDNVLNVVDADRMIRLPERKLMVAFVISEQLLDCNKELKQANIAMEKKIQEVHTVLEEKEKELGRLHQQLDQDRRQYKDFADLYEQRMEAHEKSRREHALSTEDAERQLELSEKKAMVTLLMADHLMKRIEVGQLTVAEKEMVLETLQLQLEENDSHYKEVCNGHLLMIEKYENLLEEHKTCLRDSNNDLKVQVQVLAERHMREVDQALEILDKALSVHDTSIAGGQFMTNVKEGLDMLFHEVTQLETSVHRLEAVENEFSRVIHLEEDNKAEEGAALRGLKCSNTGLATTLNIKEMELEAARKDCELYKFALEKEAASSMKWAEERSSLALETEQLKRDSLGKERVVEGLRVELHRVDLSLKQSEVKISEMLKGVQTMTVARDELELERNKLVVAAQEAEQKCSEKEQALAEIQGDLAGIQARVSEAELREQSIARRMEELVESKMHWEHDRVILNQEIETMRVAKEKLRLDVMQSNEEIERREKAIFESFRRSHQIFVKAEATMTALHQELEGLETSSGSLEHHLILLELAASSTVAVVEEMENEYREVQRRFGSVQMALDWAYAQTALEKDSRVAEKLTMQEENEKLQTLFLAREMELRDEIARAEVRLLAAEGSLKAAAENEESLRVKQVGLEQEILMLNEDALLSQSKASEQEEQIHSLREALKALQVQCTEADKNIFALDELRDQYSLSEDIWRSERELLMRRLEDSNVSSGANDEGLKEESSFISGHGDARSTHCFPPCATLSVVDDGQQQLHRQRLDNDVLRAKIGEKDSTILSARKEMEIAIANLSEAELEMDKVHREKERLRKIHLADTDLIDSICSKLKKAEEELVKSEIEIEGREAELRRMAASVADWEAKMRDAEIKWRREEAALAQELTAAKLDASEKSSEAAVLLQKFQSVQATLKEAEDLVDALVRANEAAKHNAQDWKTEKESLGIVQGWWMPEREKLVSLIGRLENDMYTQKHEMWNTLAETVLCLIETIDEVSNANSEFSMFKNHHEQKMELLLKDIQSLRTDVLAGLKLPVELRSDVEAFSQLFRNQTTQLVKAEMFHNLTEEICQLKAERESALNDYSELRIDITNLDVNNRVVESEAEVFRPQASECLRPEEESVQQALQSTNAQNVAVAEALSDLKHFVCTVQAAVVEFEQELSETNIGVVVNLDKRLRKIAKAADPDIGCSKPESACQSILDLTAHLIHLEVKRGHLEMKMGKKIRMVEEEKMRTTKDLEDELSIVRGQNAVWNESFTQKMRTTEDLEEKLSVVQGQNAQYLKTINDQLLHWQDETNQSQATIMELLQTQASLVGQLDEARVGSTALSAKNDQLRTCLEDVQHLYSTCTKDIATLTRECAAQGSIVHEVSSLLEMEFECVFQTGIVIMEELGAAHRQMKDDACKIAALREEVLAPLKHELILEQKQVAAIVSKKNVVVQELKKDRTSLLNHLDEHLKKLQRFSVDSASYEEEAGDHYFSDVPSSIWNPVLNTQLQLQTFDATLERVLHEKEGMKSQIETLLPQLSALELDINEKSAQLKNLLTNQVAVEELRVWQKQENCQLTVQVQELQLRNSALEDELDEKRHAIDLLSEELVLADQNSGHSLQVMYKQLRDIESDRDRLQTEGVVLNEQLEMAQTLADERDVVAAEARQMAERSKSQAEEKEEEAKILGKSVEELESTVYALESQLSIVKQESDSQRVARETLEKDLEKVKRQVVETQSAIDRHESDSVRDVQEAVSVKSDLDRIVIEMKNQQIQARESVESLQQECAEKEVQLRSCKAHIAELMVGAEKQASENQLKLKTLESMVDNLKLEERKVNPAGTTVIKVGDKSATTKVKGAGSPFKCIGAGLAQQRTSEMDEELSIARRRIKDLESVAASRQKEVFMLNTKLAEAESMTHDVVRDLLGVKMDIASYASLLNQQQVQRIAERARRRTVEAQQKEEELDTLRGRLNEFVEERESWLEEINRRQAEAVAARVSAEKLRLRDQSLTSENERVLEESSAMREKVTSLEEEIKKLSGQQNLQQRIHHHAKIKEENNSLRLQNEDLSVKLRRMEILFARVNDELARYRTSEGKSAFLNFDEESRLRKKLQETEENRLQLAQSFIGLCTGIMQAAGIHRTSKDVDPAIAMGALQQLQDRQESLERELSDYKLRVKVAGEKRRLSDLREYHTAGKTNFTANQQLPSPVSSSR